MTWLAWRQFRLQALSGAFALGAAAVLVAATGLHLHHLFGASAVAGCASQHGCGALSAALLTHDRILQQLLGPLILAIPGVIGIFWGAPLVARELESGSYRLAWTQSVSRTRWLAVKVGLIGVASMAVAEAASLLVSWWFSPVDGINLDRFTPGVFDERGIVALGYGALAFAIGVTAGILVRRTLPAMTATLIAFIGARFALVFWMRPHLESPVRVDMPLIGGSSLGFLATPHGATVFRNPPKIADAWVLSAQLVDRAGHAPTARALSRLISQHCPAIATRSPNAPPPPAAFRACTGQLASGLRLRVVYQPASRYWAFQTFELLICLGLAVAVLGAGFWWLRRRLV